MIRDGLLTFYPYDDYASFAITENFKKPYRRRIKEFAIFLYYSKI